MKKSKGKITISRTTSGDGDYISVQITDELSGCRFIEVEISMEGFARAVTGFGYIDCEFWLNDSNVGLRREVKTEEVRCEWNGGRDENKAKAILSQYEVDGWKGRQEDLFNHHRRTSNGYNVTFIRFVKP